jgi:pectate lyase
VRLDQSLVPSGMSYARFARRSSSAAAAACALALGACSSMPRSVPEAEPEVREPVTFDENVIGWASVPDLGLEGTTGGLGGEIVEVATLADFVREINVVGPRIVVINGVIGDGTRVSITANKTVLGAVGAEFHGGLRVDGATNVIVRNLKIVGNNCSDSPDECSGGADAFSIGDSAHHVWVDHCDISDGSDGNLDVNDGADYVTISFTKFSYSGQRPGSHQFSNLVGSGDNVPSDAGHLRVTYHHNWWADNVQERMPRVRYGAVHVFNNLYTATGNNYCIGLGYYANVLSENNTFVGVQDPIQSVKYSNAESVLVTRGDLFLGTSGAREGKAGASFEPPYAYQLESPESIEQSVRKNAGVCAAPNVFTAGAVPTCAAP